MGAHSFGPMIALAGCRDLRETTPAVACRFLPAFAGRPVPDAIAGLRDTVTVSGIGLDGMPETSKDQPPAAPPAGAPDRPRR